MSSRYRDRHARGIRGPLALPNPHSKRPAFSSGSTGPHRTQGKADFFADVVHLAVDQIALQCPDALVGVTFGIEEVPHLETAWSGNRVPLAAALEATPDQLSQVVVYRRPLEHRSASRQGLRILVYRTIVEQLSALTGRTVDEIDPEGAGDDEDDGRD